MVHLSQIREDLITFADKLGALDEEVYVKIENKVDRIFVGKIGQPEYIEVSTYVRFYDEPYNGLNVYYYLSKECWVHIGSMLNPHEVYNLCVDLLDIDHKPAWKSPSHWWSGR